MGQLDDLLIAILPYSVKQLHSDYEESFIEKTGCASTCFFHEAFIMIYCLYLYLVFIYSSITLLSILFVNHWYVE